MAFDPNYASNGFLYVNYTTSIPAPRRTRISRFSVTADPDAADPDSESIILEFTQPYANHNGGALHFGPDGYLYIATGDGGSGGDPQGYGQNKATLLGKLLRIDVHGTGAPGSCDVSTNAPRRYAIPPGNPFADGDGGNCDEIWDLGLRNPWRFSFDRATGGLWIADVGQNTREEVDYEPPNSAGGVNYGWRCYEGNAAYNTAGCAAASAYTFPVHEYLHADGNCSITGGYVYRGPTLTGLYGHYVFSDYCTGTLWTLSGAPAAPTLTTWSLAAGSTLATPSTFGEDAGGEMYVASLGGKVYRLGDAAPPAVAPDASIAQTGATTSPSTWTTDAANCSYQVLEGLSPYFAPAAGALVTTLGSGSTWHGLSNRLGDPDVHHFYIIRAVNCSSLRVADAGGVGEFEFTLEPGAAQTAAQIWMPLACGTAAPGGAASRGLNPWH